MNKLLLLPLFLLVCLLDSTRPASAISIVNVEHSSSRLAFDIVWGASFASAGTSIAQPDSKYNISVFNPDDPISITVLAEASAPGLQVQDLFEVFFASDIDRSFASADVRGFAGVEVLPLSDPYSARFVYGAPYSTPESGPTLALLGLSLVGMAGANLRMRRA